MSLASSIEGFVEHIRANLDGFDENNCKGFDDETVFDYVISNDLSPSPQRGVIISYGGIAENAGDISEFGGMVLGWIIIITGIFPLWGDEIVEVNEVIQSGHTFVDELISSIVVDSTLGGAAMGCRIIDAEPPLTYKRNANEFLLMSLRFMLVENL